MANANFDTDKAARVLIEAALTTDKEAAARFGVAARTVRHYRKRLKEDAELAAVYQNYVKLAIGEKNLEQSVVNWVGQLNDTLSVLLTSMQNAAVGLEPSPESLEAISKAFAVVGELHTAREVLSVGSNDTDKQAGAPEEAGRGAAEDFEARYN